MKTYIEFNCLNSELRQFRKVQKLSLKFRSLTRTHNLDYTQLHTSYEQYKNSFLPRTIREWNALPPDLVHAVSADEFAARLQNHTF